VSKPNVHRLLLKEFWKDIGSYNGRKMHGKHLEPDHKMTILKEYSQYYHGAGSNLVSDRNYFNSIKHEVRSIKITKYSECFVCRGNADVRHHVVPLKNSGSNSRQNIVHLCKPCHAEIHPWLKKYL
jgi:5-methylcytosine-specific restriction endonuclease McrA